MTVTLLFAIHNDVHDVHDCVNTMHQITGKNGNRIPEVALGPDGYRYTTLGRTVYFSTCLFWKRSYVPQT